MQNKTAFFPRHLPRILTGYSIGQFHTNCIILLVCLAFLRHDQNTWQIFSIIEKDLL